MQEIPHLPPTLVDLFRPSLSLSIRDRIIIVAWWWFCQGFVDGSGVPVNYHLLDNERGDDKWGPTLRREVLQQGNGEKL